MAITKRSTKGTALTHDELDANFTHLGGDGTYVMPTTDGTSGQVMSTNGSGQVSFTTLTGVTATIANAYPVGSIYMNATNSTNPATLLGFGTWSSFGAGRVLIGLDSSDTDFDSAEETGGAKHIHYLLLNYQLILIQFQVLYQEVDTLMRIINSILDYLERTMILILMYQIQVVEALIIMFNHILLSICGKEQHNLYK